MIHKMFQDETAEDLLKSAEVLDKISEIIKNTLLNKNIYMFI